MTAKRRIGNRLAPARFLAFLGIFAVASALLAVPFGWVHGAMLGFDCAVLVFLASLVPLVRSSDPSQMREHAARDDANRALMLAITFVVSVAVMIAIGTELAQKGSPQASIVVLIVGTLAMAWLFTNTVYALHYAHIFYTQGDTNGDGTKEDLGGLDFPETDEPVYWDFLYYSFTLGMTFQTSDVDTTTRQVRVVTIFHCLAAFVFNIGVIAFTVNVLGGG